jgi:PPOX class probable F420-dependent enzyme
MNLPEGLIALLRQPSPCFLATVMPDGSPQMTQTWVDTDGEHVVINTVQGHQKVKNIKRDPRVAVNICDVSNPSRYYAIRGRVINITTEGGADHIEALAQRYLGAPYPWYGGRDQIRVILTIRADTIRAMGQARHHHGPGRQPPSQPGGGTR